MTIVKVAIVGGIYVAINVTTGETIAETSDPNGGSWLLSRAAIEADLIIVDSSWGAVKI